MGWVAVRKGRDAALSGNLDPYFKRSYTQHSQSPTNHRSITTRQQCKRFRYQTLVLALAILSLIDHPALSDNKGVHFSCIL